MVEEKQKLLVNKAEEIKENMVRRT